MIPAEVRPLKARPLPPPQPAYVPPKPQTFWTAAVISKYSNLKSAYQVEQANCAHAG